ncbi:hypothetical protein [Belnapia rosea]|uniref:hypothetical protein n=1 Tax=Belnapia rosea TaxID=938405 RepID=UPI0015A0B4F0|nr:hypothetical protein [Belnapia rosea]
MRDIIHLGRLNADKDGEGCGGLSFHDSGVARIDPATENRTRSVNPDLPGRLSWPRQLQQQVEREHCQVV